MVSTAEGSSGAAMAAEGKITEAPEARARATACAAAAKAGKLAVFLDFDRTVTRCFLSNGGRGTSAHGVLESAGVLSAEFRERAKKLFDKYYPIEIHPTMSIEEKIPIMSEWYGQVHSLMLQEERMTRKSLHDAVTECQTVELREGMVELIRLCQEACPPVPVFVMSAGLGDVIEDYLQQSLPFRLAPSTLVVSNRMSFDDEGRLTSFSEPLMHMFNKTAAFMAEEARALTAGCTQCLVVGDGVGDLTMADGLDVEKFTIGFLNEKIEERFEQYRGLFDVVIPGDGPVPDICFEAIGAQAPARKQD